MQQAALRVLRTLLDNAKHVTSQRDRQREAYNARIASIQRE